MKHSSPVPKRAQHSCFSSSYPFHLIPCTALLASWLLSHSLESTEWKGVFQGWDLPHQKPGPWMSTCRSVFQSAHVLFLFIYNLVKVINLYTPIHQFPLCSISQCLHHCWQSNGNVELWAKDHITDFYSDTDWKTSTLSTVRVNSNHLIFKRGSRLACSETNYLWIATWQ